MFCKIADLPHGVGVPCQIIGYGHTEISDDPRFLLVSQYDFIRNFMTDKGRSDLFEHDPPYTALEVWWKAKTWTNKITTKNRPFFFGSTAELAAIAAKKCLVQAQVNADDLDAIICGTNTGPGYPSLADSVKLSLGVESKAMCHDLTEACTVGSISVFEGSSLIRSGVCKKVLVVCSEKATKLTTVDNWLASNLFSDAAFAFLLSAADTESFVFFDFHSMPYNGYIDAIVKKDTGFYQDGDKVHKFVGRQVVDSLVEAIERAGIDPASIKHLVPHHPSGKTLILLEENFKRRCKKFSGVFYNIIRNMGNPSGASTGWIISEKIKEGKIKKGDLIVVITFGSGLSIGSYGFYA